jgi:glyoxylase-like metal-dependent hydrolase (beta-lactamase superfamily II)
VQFSDYAEMGGRVFPKRIRRTQGGHPVLDITVSGVTVNPAAVIAAPDAVRSFAPPPVTVNVESLAAGVSYLTGGSHHSLVIEQKDHVVVFEAPQSEARSLAVIAKVKDMIPGKPIKYLVPTHHHFDHSGGIRTYVDEGSTIVVPEVSRPFYEKAWAAPRTLNPDRLAQSKKSATFETFADKHVLTDGSRTIELHAIAGSGHADGFVMLYLPKEKIVSEVDAWAPPAPGAPPPASVSPFATNLYENIQRLKLDVRRIAPLHGPGMATMADFVAAVKPAAPAQTN